jgi:hypothetical protein
MWTSSIPAKQAVKLDSLLFSKAQAKKSTRFGQTRRLTCGLRSKGVTINVSSRTLSLAAG